MSRVIGAKDHFAVEYELELLDSPDQMRWLPGHIAFWAANRMIGRYQVGAELTVALAIFPRLLANRRCRQEPRLLELPLQNAFHEIYSALHVDSGQSDEQVEQAWSRYSPLYAVPIGVDVFDGWMGFLVEDNVRGRYMWRDPDDTLHEAFLRAGEFDDVINAFLIELEERTGQKRRTE